MSVYEITLLLNGEKDREERIREAFDKVVARNGAALKRLADSDDIVEHNGKQYRKVKRKAAVGELVVYDGDESYRGPLEVVPSGYDGFNHKKHTFITLTERESNSVLEPIEQSGQSETLTEVDQDGVLDALANLAQEVAELKRRLTNAATDIADLEDRVDENEKDTEELVGRINDVSDAVVPVDAVEKVIAELEKREDRADDMGGVYEVQYQKELAQFHDGKAHAFSEAVELLKEALRNG